MSKLEDFKGENEKDDTYRKVAQRLEETNAWIKEHKLKSFMILMGIIVVTDIIHARVSQAIDVGNLRDDITELRNDFHDQLQNVDKKDVEAIKQILSEKREELHLINAQLEELNKTGFKLRLDVVEESDKAIMDAMKATKNGDVRMLATIDNVADIVGSFTGSETIGKGKNLLRDLTGINLSSYPGLNEEMDLLGVELMKTHEQLVEMEDIDLITPSNNSVVNMKWPDSGNKLIEKRKVEKIADMKKLREERLEQLATLSKTFGFFAHIGDLDEKEAKKIKDDFRHFAKLVDFMKGKTASTKKVTAAMIHLQKEMFDICVDKSKENVTSDDVRTSQKLLIGLGFLKKGHVTGVVDAATEKAKEDFVLAMFDLLVHCLAIETERAPEKGPKIDQLQQVLLYLGYIQEKDKDGVYGSLTERRFMRLYQDSLEEEALDSPIAFMKGGWNVVNAK